MSQFDNAAVSAHLSHVRIVMVNTTLPANIGSALRAMKTMGLTNLWLVNPLVKPDSQAIALAAGASDVREALMRSSMLQDGVNWKRQGISPLPICVMLRPQA